MSKVGRPSKLNEIMIQMLEKAFGIGMKTTLACQHAGVSKSTFNTWMQRGDRERKEEEDTIYTDLHRRVKKAESNHALANLALIQKAAKETNSWQAAAWLLERKHNYNRQVDPLVEVKIDNRQLSSIQLMQELKNADQKINEIIQIPVIDLDEE